jgi:hypothetical protein
LLGVEQIPQDKYDVAGRLVGYLLVERGPALMLELLDNVPDGTPRPFVCRRFRAVLGARFTPTDSGRRSDPTRLSSRSGWHRAGNRARAPRNL